MELLKEIANFSGKSGLYRILKPGRGGVIVESLDAKREKSMIGASARVSVLKDISIFMADSDQATPLATVFENIHSKYQGEALDPKAMSDYQLVDFMGGVLPGYDTERVYLSDIRKIISWYNILLVQVPQVFEPAAEEQPAAEAAEEEAK
ncbi:DUF5606 domain-containing protein [Runella sp. SP2]|uniref:DUF5606 family protein n=1 Tax=Runella sp. SP2 TaxID=2268026 RepID=UPI000F0915BF|nr:DUF5606 domain-containing protein [Runella sp. SP2]AYQ33488.1 hypothetical protein DTQ70_15560 [Runella sp. SP2]